MAGTPASVTVIPPCWKEKIAKPVGDALEPEGRTRTEPTVMDCDNPDVVNLKASRARTLYWKVLFVRLFAVKVRAFPA